MQFLTNETIFLLVLIIVLCECAAIPYYLYTEYKRRNET